MKRFNSPLVISLVIAGFFAQSLVGAPPRGGPPGPSDPKPRGGPIGPTKGPTEPTGGRGAGGREGTHAKGMINSFTPAKESEDETLVGTLSLKPNEKGAKLLNLKVRRDVEYKLGDSKLDPEIALELLWKGLMVSVAFDADRPDEGKKKAPTQKALKGLAIEAVELEGKVVEIGEDYVVLDAKPLSGDWPDAETSSKNGPSATGKSAAKPRQLKLKTVEKVTRFLNKDMRPTDSSEFAKDEKIQAAAGISKGHGQGVLINLHPPLVINSQQPGNRPKPPPSKRPTGGREQPGG